MDQHIFTVNLKLKPCRPLTALLREYYSPEILKKLRHCTHRNSDQVVQISAVIKEEPCILIFHVLRFKEYGTDKLEKLELPFSQELRLFHTKDNGRPLYSLTAIVFYLGKNFDSAHYICVIKSDNRQQNCVRNAFIEEDIRVLKAHARPMIRIKGLLKCGLIDHLHVLIQVKEQPPVVTLDDTYIVARVEVLSQVEDDGCE
ncbi:hypothetical protein Droror1_Dr00001246 [Drosera rotundifolia]